MDEVVKRGPGRPRKDETVATLEPSTVRVRCIVADCWDSVGKHELGAEFETSVQDSVILLEKRQVEAC